MICLVLPLLIGFGIDCVLGDPHSLPHPVVLIGKTISALECVLRRIFPKTPRGERLAGLTMAIVLPVGTLLLTGGVCRALAAIHPALGFAAELLWLIVAFLAAAVPALLLCLCGRVSPWLRLAVESVMCWQILAAKSLRDESMKVYHELEHGSIESARRAVSMIVGRDTAALDDAGVTRAAVETVAENTSDGVVAPLLYLAIGGAPLGFFYKAVNTMDSMLGYVEPPYKDIGLMPAKADDIANYLPARISALLMLAAGGLLRMDVKNGWKIFRRDRYKHASPNSAQTESVCAGLLDVRLAGDAWYHGVLHKKEYIGDALRQIKHEDIPRACRLMYGTTLLALLLGCAVRLLIFSL